MIMNSGLACENQQLNPQPMLGLLGGTRNKNLKCCKGFAVICELILHQPNGNTNNQTGYFYSRYGNWHLMGAEGSFMIVYDLNETWSSLASKIGSLGEYRW